jgi:predicted esterase
MIVAIFSVILLFCVTVLTVHAQSDLQTTKYRNMVIDLGDGVKTNARLNIPTTGNGPFPGVLYVFGSGTQDMNETAGATHIDNETGSIIYPPSRMGFDVSQYLSERGFAVLQYNKRGYGGNGTFSDSNVYANITFDDLVHDADKALHVLVQQPEVDSNDISVIGHSEGTEVVPRVAFNNPGLVDNIVLMGAVAQNFTKIGEFQGVSLPILYAKQILDHNHNGMLSVNEASENPVFGSMVGNITLLLAQNVTTPANGTARQISPQYDTNNDTFISISDELKPSLIESLKSLSVVKPGEECDVLRVPCPIWLKSKYAAIPTLDIISKVPSDTSILIMQGKNDSQTSIQQALLLQQKLTETKHPDHTLKTYPDLGHAFFPSSQWLTALGPVEPKVLEDLFDWLSDPVRDFKKITVLSSQAS